MKHLKSRQIALCAMMFVGSCTSPVSSEAGEPLFDAASPVNLGTVAGSYQPAEVLLAGVTAWKSVRVQSTFTGSVTHFLIKILSTQNITTAPVGFAIYEGTAGYNDAIGPLIARGYYQSYRFENGAGWYALPFTNPPTFTVTTGNYYHLAFLLNPEATALNFARANNAEPYPPKWRSTCQGVACNHQEPPGVGAEYWNLQYDATSAPWVMGILAVGNSSDTTPPAPPRGLSVR